MDNNLFIWEDSVKKRLVNEGPLSIPDFFLKPQKKWNFSVKNRCRLQKYGFKTLLTGQKETLVLFHQG